MSRMAQRTATAIRFEATLETIGSAIIARLPADASAALPSRGQVAVQGTANGTDFRTVVEPDGRRGHWIRVDRTLQRTAAVTARDVVAFALETTSEWPEPEVPQDLAAALTSAPDDIQDMWHDITPMARWEWVRWVNATANTGTRQRRVAVTISKMQAGKRRPCCFDLSACTDPTVAKSGKLRNPT
jgi:uncharacterized protein (DUF2267 family)